MSVQSTRAASVKALTDGTLLALTRDDFNHLLGSLADIRHMWRFEALRMVTGLKLLPPSQCLQPLCACFINPGMCLHLKSRHKQISEVNPKTK